MEILKFSEPPKRNSGRSRNRSGLQGMVAFGIAVLVFGGMSTTLAGTISLNSGSVEFGQGVVTTAACDTTIKVTPVSSYDTSTSTFYVSELNLADIGVATTDTSTTGWEATGCLGKYFTLKAYSSSGQLYMNTAQNVDYVKFKIPSTIANAQNSGQYTSNKTGAGTILSVSGFTALTGTDGTADSGHIQIASIKIPSSVVKITVESSDS